MLLFSCANKYVSQKETHRLRKWTYDYRGVGTAREGHIHTAIFKMDNQQRPIV